MNTLMRFPGGRAKAFTLSYDDGVRQDKRFVKIINRYGLKATFNINTGRFGKEREDNPEKQTGCMCIEEALETYKGHEVAVHSLTHPHLEKLPPSQVIYEINQDRLNIERTFGKFARGMAYPYGTYSDDVLQVLSLCGIAYSRTVRPTCSFDVPTDWLRMPPTCHHSHPEIWNLTDIFLSEHSGELPWIFYVWGHSYEFDFNVPNNNWEHIESFVKKISGHEDEVWYATNIEIYDYVQAFNRLVWSANGKTVHNPTTTDVWVADWNKDAVCIKSGATVTL